MAGGRVCSFFFVHGRCIIFGQPRLCHRSLAFHESHRTGVKKNKKQKTKRKMLVISLIFFISNRSGFRILSGWGPCPSAITQVDLHVSRVFDVLLMSPEMISLTRVLRVSSPGLGECNLVIRQFHSNSIISVSLSVSLTARHYCVCVWVYVCVSVCVHSRLSPDSCIDHLSPIYQVLHRTLVVTSAFWIGSLCPHPLPRSIVCNWRHYRCSFLPPGFCWMLLSALSRFVFRFVVFFGGVGRFGLLVFLPTYPRLLFPYRWSLEFSTHH